jgi:uncharacterized protein YmfQ (DUF2313 family)
MTVKWADVDLETTGFSGASEDQYFGWQELDAWMPTAGTDDVVRVRGNRNNQGAGVLWEPGGATLSAWDLKRYGPWCIRTTQDISIDSMLKDCVLYCRDWWSHEGVYNAHVIASRQVAIPETATVWRGVKVWTPYVGWTSPTGVSSIDGQNCVIRTAQVGSVYENATVTTKFRNSVLSIANAKSAWFDSGSPGYAAATWDVDDTCKFSIPIPATEWNDVLSRARYCMPWSVRDSGVVPSGSYTGYEQDLWGEPRSGVGGYVMGHPHHYAALKQLLPGLPAGIDMGTDFDRSLWCIAVSLDVANDTAADLQQEILAATALRTLPDWERVCGIAPAAGATIPSRRLAVLAMLRATGGLNHSYFEGIASGLGYAIGPTGDKHLRIVEDEFGPFRADYGRADIDAVYNQGAGASMYTWKAVGSLVESDTELQRHFENLKPAGTEVLFENE